MVSCSHLLAALAVLVAAPLHGAEFYVAPDGKDDQAGTLEAPFATVNRATRTIAPGDTVFIRGGTYKMTEAQIARRNRGRAWVNSLSKSGKPGQPINYFAYQNEQPVFDFSEVNPKGMRVTGFHVTGSHLHLKGLSVVGVQVTVTGHTQSICFDNEGSDNVYEMLQMHDGQAIGFWLGNGSNNLVLNCDAYRNHDYTSENKKGGNVDGFGFHVPQGCVKNVFRGCRAWFNSDDGFDLINTHEPILIENCWSFYNGYDPSFKPLGDGNGFKLGGYGIQPGAEAPPVVPRHVTRNSMAVHNRASGFYANHQPGGIDLLNNSAYLNSTNFNLLGRNPEMTADVPGFGHKLKNNLGYKGRTEVSNLNASVCDVSGNYFTLKLHFSDKDFQGLDEADLVKPRQPNGDLPDVPLLHLKPGNPAIDKGVDIGLPFHGKAPDLGAFESGKAK